MRGSRRRRTPQRAALTLGALTLATLLSAAACGPDEAEVDAAFEDVSSFAEPRVSCSKSCLLSVDLAPDVTTGHVVEALAAARSLELDTVLTIQTPDDRLASLDVGGDSDGDHDTALAEALVELRDNPAVRHARIGFGGGPPADVDVRLDGDAAFWDEAPGVHAAVAGLADAQLEVATEGRRGPHRILVAGRFPDDTVSMLAELTSDDAFAASVSGILLRPERLTIGVHYYREVESVRAQVTGRQGGGSSPEVAVHATDDPALLGWAPDFAPLVQGLATDVDVRALTQSRDTLSISLDDRDTSRARELYEQFDAGATDDRPALVLSFDRLRTEMTLDPGHDPAFAALDVALRSGVGSIGRIHSRTLSGEDAHNDAFVDLSVGGDVETVVPRVAAAVAAWSRAEAPRAGRVELSISADDGSVGLVIDTADGRLVEVRSGEESDVRRAWERGLS